MKPLATTGNKKRDAGRQKERQAGRQGETRQHGKSDTPSNKVNQEGAKWETKPSGRLTHYPAKGNKKMQNGRERKRKGEKTVGKADTPSNKEKLEGAQWVTGTMGDKGRQDPGEGRHAIQQRETGRRTHHPTPRLTPSDSTKNS